MSELVNIHAAKTQFSKLVERAHNGEEIILAKNGKAYARLVPLEPASLAPRQLGFLGIKLSPQSTQALLAPLDAEELKRWQ
jgi:prevent-host-death family protein